MSGSARRLGKFCFIGLLLGIALSCALLLASELTGQRLSGNSGFGRVARIFWPAVFMFGILDVVSNSLIPTLFAVAIGANGLIYAGIGALAFLADRLADRIAEAFSAH